MIFFPYKCTHLIFSQCCLHSEIRTPYKQGHFWLILRVSLFHRFHCILQLETLSHRPPTFASFALVLVERWLVFAVLSTVVADKVSIVAETLLVHTYKHKSTHMFLCRHFTLYIYPQRWHKQWSCWTSFKKAWCSLAFKRTFHKQQARNANSQQATNEFSW
jgi:hypothetical protein